CTRIAIGYPPSENWFDFW
nr:immunoglobulin heavy chain junction region [Macaca mulatta]